MSRVVVGSPGGAQMILNIPRSLERALKNPVFVDQPIKNFMERGAFTIQGEAQERAPTGVSGGAGLRGSIKVDFKRNYREANIGSNLRYAAAQEFGTRPFWPPYKSPSFQRWAQLKRTNAFLVARAIARRGIKPKRYMSNAYDAYMRGPMQRHLGQFKTELQAAWKKGR